MSRYRTKLPSFAALVAFEAAARRGSFTEAAHELNVTQPAVSRQIRGLEQMLQLRLFRRLHRSVDLTQHGRLLNIAVSGAFAQIARTFEELEDAKDCEELTVSSLVAFSNMWLTPRISKFRQQHPEIRVKVVSKDRHVSLSKGEVHLTIRFGDGDWTDGVSSLLFREELFPVSSPAYLAAHGGAVRLEDLKHHALIGYDKSGEEWLGWNDLLGHHGVEKLKGKIEDHYSYYTDAVTAARNGSGVLLGWRALIRDHLDAGSLVRTDDRSLLTKGGHYLVVAFDSLERPAVQSFAAWLKASI